MKKNPAVTVTLNNAEISETYVSPKGLNIRVLGKNADGSVCIELLDILEEGVNQELTIPKIDAERTGLIPLKRVEPIIEEKI